MVAEVGGILWKFKSNIVVCSLWPVILPEENGCVVDGASSVISIALDLQSQESQDTAADPACTKHRYLVRLVAIIFCNQACPYEGR